MLFYTSLITENSFFYLQILVSCTPIYSHTACLVCFTHHILKVCLHPKGMLLVKCAMTTSVLTMRAHLVQTQLVVE